MFMRIEFALLAALPLTAAPMLPAIAQAVAAPTAAEQAVLDVEHKRFDAQVAADVPALSAAIADEAVYIHASGQTQGKAEYLKDVVSGASKYRAIEASERSAHIYGAIAVTHGIATLHVGTDRTIPTRYTGVYLKRGGKWLVLSWQTTPNSGPARQ